MKPIAWACLLATLSVAPRTGGAEPRTRPDTLVVPLPVVEVTALRGRDRIGEIPAAAFVLSRDDIRRAGSARLSTLLQNVPGLFAYGQDSDGDVNIVEPRGFSASGESSYLKLLVDGQDVRDLENGNVDWDWVAPADVERVEIVQGPGAWAYGDASEGGIVNVVRAPLRSQFGSSVSARGGSFGLRSASFDASGPLGDQRLGLNGFGRDVDGWRDRSRQRVYGGGAEAGTVWGGRSLTLQVSALDANRQNPGALTADAMAHDPTQAASNIDFDHGRRQRIGARLQSTPGPEPTWALAPYLRRDDTDQVRTLFFQPQFHHTLGWTGGGAIEWRAHGSLGGRNVSMLGEGSIEQASLESNYDAFDPDLGRGARLASGRSARSMGAASMSTRIELDPRTVARLSVRGDLARVRSTDETTGARTPTRSLDALSPLLGLTRQIGASGSVYASGSTAFRVPTLYQMFDRRPFFVGPPPPVTISNSQLEPQRAISVEAGARWDRPGGASAQLAAYSTRVRNEIDFDINTLQYANISRSWHRGLEGQLRCPLPGHVTALAGGAWTPTTFRGGDFDGRQINGVPLGTGNASLAWAPLEGGSVDLGARYVGRRFLDKLQTDPLGSVVVWDAGLHASHGRFDAGIRLVNLFGKRYAESGFIDPLVGEQFLPAAPRSVSVSLTLD